MTERIVTSDSPTGASSSAPPRTRLAALIGSIVLTSVVVAAANWPALTSRARAFDDDLYVAGNPLVRNPGWQSARRFLTEVLRPSTIPGYYHPLTMLSLMADVALGGSPDDPRAFHRTSLALHVANCVLLVALLYFLFGEPWPAAAGAILFGVHPLMAEPVVWLGQRKAILAGFFALWSLALYAKYCRREGKLSYVGSLITYALALLAKPTSTPVPVLMLVLDYWPLRRLGRKALVEKIPFAAIGGVSAFITATSHFANGASMELSGGVPVTQAVLLACSKLAFFLSKLAWPAGLSSFYPMPEPLALTNPTILLSVAVVVVTAVAIGLSVRWTRAVLAGGLFFLLAILPTLGLVKYSWVYVLNNYAYLPAVGWLLPMTGAAAAIWRSGSLSRRFPPTRWAVIGVTAMVAIPLGVATHRYLGPWRDTVSLYQHMLALAPDSYELNNDLGVALRRRGEFDRAVQHFRKALALQPASAVAAYNIGSVLDRQGRIPEAIAQYRMAIGMRDDYPTAHLALAETLLETGATEEAVREYRRTLALHPETAAAYNGLGKAMRKLGQVAEAGNCFRRAVEIDSSFGEAYLNLGFLLIESGDTREGIRQVTRGLAIQPSARGHCVLGHVLVQEGRPAEAAAHYREALRLDPNYEDARQALAKIPR